MNLSEEKALIIKSRIQSAQKHRETWLSTDGDPDARGFETRPEFWLSVITNKYWRDRRRNNENAPIIRSSNQILPKLRVKHDTLTNGETVFLADANLQRFSGKEDEVAALLTNDWHALGFEAPTNSARWDSEIYSFGIVEMGWEFIRDNETLRGERGEPEVLPNAEPITPDILGMMTPPPAAPDMGGLPGMGMEQGMGMPGQGLPPEMAEMMAKEAEAKAEAEEAAIWGNPTKDDPFMERFSPLDFLLDPQCVEADLSDCRYAVREKLEFLETVKNDPRLKHTKELEGTAELPIEATNKFDASTYKGSRDDARMVRIYDGYYKLEIGGEEKLVHAITTDEHDKILYAEEDTYQWPDDNPFPFVPMSGPRDDFDSFYQEPPVSYAVPLQLSLDEALHQLNTRRRKSPRQYLAAKGIFDPRARADLESGRDGAVIEINQGDINSVRDLPHIPLQPEVYATLNEIPEEIARQLGVTQYSEAVLPQKDMLATEIRAQTELGAARQTGDAERFRKFKETVGLRILALYQQFAVRGRTFSTADQTGETQFNTLSMDELRGINPVSGEPENIGIQWKIRLDADNDRNRSKASERQEKNMLLAALAPYGRIPDPEMPIRPMLNIKPIVKYVLKAFDFPEIEEVMNPQISPMMMMAAQQPPPESKNGNQNESKVQ